MPPHTALHFEKPKKTSAHGELSREPSRKADGAGQQQQALLSSLGRGVQYRRLHPWGSLRDAGVAAEDP